MPSNYDNIYSVIDLGTNTCLLLIASLYEKELTKLFEAQEIPRLGKDLYKTGKISEDAFVKVAKIFIEYISVSKKYNSKDIFAFGTSALREAKNSMEFIEFIRNKTGIAIKIISGKDEAEYGYEGAINDLPGNKYTVLDIGGGSTELGLKESGKLISESFNIGSVRIYENYFKENFSIESISKVRNFVKGVLDSNKFDLINLKAKDLVGVAGTLTTLSAIKNKLNNFDEDIIHKDELSLNEIENIFKKLIKMTNEERLSIGEFMKGRSEIIISGALILIEVMKYFDYKSVLVSTKGLRYGLLINIADFNN